MSAQDNSVRLQKFLSQAGIASRRKAETMILEGRVEVDGRVVTELGTKIDPDVSKVMVDGEPVRAEVDRATVLLNKPHAVVTTMADPEGRRTVAELVSAEPYRLLPVGRLDYLSEGALLLTNDGELANRLLHPRYKAPKVYTVKVGGRPNAAALRQLREGIVLEDGATQPAVVELLEQDAKHSWLEFIITEGKNRQIRRMCEAIGHRPLRVFRTEFAGIQVEGLRPGQYRYLTDAELHALYKMVGLARQAPPPSARAEATVGRGLGDAERRKGRLPGEERRPPRPQKESPKRPKKKRLVSKNRPEPSARSDAAKKPARTKKPTDKAAPSASKGIRPADYRKRTQTPSK